MTRTRARHVRSPRGTLPTLAQAARGDIRIAPRLVELSGASPAVLVARLESTTQGLTTPEAARRLLLLGANEMVATRAGGWLARLWSAVRNPLVLLLTTLGVVSAATGDLRAATVIGAMIVIGV